MSCLLWGGLIVPSYSPDRLVSQSATKSCSRAKILFELGCDTLEQRRYKHRMITFFKMVKKKLTPPYLQDLVPPSVHQVSNRNLRNQFDLTIPRSRTNLYDSSFIPTATREWNSLPEEIKSSTSIAIFKRMLNRDKVKVPFFFYNGNRKAQILHARIRLGCSFLNADLFINHISLTNKCSCGSVLRNCWTFPFTLSQIYITSWWNNQYHKC